METIHLKRDRHKRLLAGHSWVFAGEITEDIKRFKPGEMVAVCESKGRLLGRGYINPHTLIAVRLLTYGNEAFDDSLFFRRIEEAYNYRKINCPGWKVYRLIYSEADRLPGLIVDNYDGYLVMQSLTAGIEQRLDRITEALIEVVQPKGIFLKGNSPYRKLEGLDEGDRLLYGTMPDEVLIDEFGLKFTVRPVHGQKSGYYLDQRMNRQLLSSIAEGKNILDLFCYTGAWGLTGLKYGATFATMVDSSEQAVISGQKDAVNNGLSTKATYVHDDVSEYLDKAISEQRTYDIVIIDPPALIPSRSALQQGIGMYRALNTKAMKVVSQGGCLVSCSCSHLLDRDKHLELVGEAAHKNNRTVRVLAQGGHSPDHPIRPGHPESEYLTCWVIRCD